MAANTGNVGGLYVFRQLFEKTSSTYTYLLAAADKSCILIDPVEEMVDRDLTLIKELGLQLRFAVNTHCHADHVTGTGKIKSTPGFEAVKSAIGEHAESTADILLKDGEQVVFGDRAIRAVHTPGHTGGCMTYVLDDGSCAFTGDTLLIRGCGRTDFQSGDSKVLFKTVREKIFSLGDDTRLFVGHDYQGRPFTTVSEEKQHNPRLGLHKSEQEFVDIMEKLGLPYPKKIDIAVPANMVCGVYEVPQDPAPVVA